MYPPLKHANLYVEIIKVPNVMRWTCNQSYNAIAESVKHGFPIDGYVLVKEDDSTTPNTDGGTSSRITSVAINKNNDDLCILHQSVRTESNGGANIDNMYLYMHPDNTITRTHN